MFPTTRLYAQLAGAVRNPPSGGPRAKTRDSLMLVSVGSSALYLLTLGFLSETCTYEYKKKSYLVFKMKVGKITRGNA